MTYRIAFLDGRTSGTLHPFGDPDPDGVYAVETPAQIPVAWYFVDAGLADWIGDAPTREV